MTTNYVSEKKLRDALRASHEEHELIRLLKMADIAQKKVEQKECPNYYRVNAKVFDFLFGEPEKILASCAHQMVGFLGRLKKVTGSSALKCFVTAEHEIDVLNEIMDIIDEWSASTTAD